MDILKTIKALTEKPGISGFENDFARYVCEKLSEYCESAQILNSGSVVGFVKSDRENAPTIMLEAHLDRIGLIVSSVDENGFVGFEALGGVDERILPATQVRILGKEEVFGIIGAKPPHLISKDENKDELDVKDMLIDTGLSGEDAREKISVGDPIMLESEFCCLLGKRISSGALDNRVGMAAIFTCLEELKGQDLPCNLQVAFSSGEELGLHGAYGIAREKAPDLAIVIDVTYGETPDAEKTETFPLGCGVAICRGPNLHYEMTKRVIELAKSKKIPYEIEVAPGSSGTNAWAIQISGRGVPCVLLSIPLKYMHTTIETADLEDVENTCRLISEIILGGEVVA